VAGGRAEDALARRAQQRPGHHGNMGSRTRFSYTMTGDNVNLAARMESGAKSWGAYTMCTEADARHLREAGGDRVVFSPARAIVVKAARWPCRSSRASASAST